MSTPSEPQNSYSMLLKSFGDQADQTQKQKLEEVLARLEDERLKIDAFKRELPLCMQLLTNAVEASRQQLQAYRANQGPVLEEFIPLKTPTSENSDKSQNMSDKSNWMTTAQLWSQTANNETKPPQPVQLQTTTSSTTDMSPKIGLLDTKQRNGGAFLPFSKRPLPDLALASSDNQEMDDNKKCNDRDNNNGNNNLIKLESVKGVNNNPSEGQPNSNSAAANNNNQTHRKARRCWSPDLHRRFVNALQMLGGSQVATPKQIRELMKVDGLTNDEVKSHLQKYRLHTRRPSPSPQASGAGTPQLVVLGGIWVPPEYATAHGGTPAIYHHPTTHAPPHFCAAAAPQEFYTNSASVSVPAPLPPSHHHHGIHVYKGSSQSPESGGERSESIEDGKSESSSWKGESGENGKGLAALRGGEDAEESNGSEITLKF